MSYLDETGILQAKALNKMYKETVRNITNEGFAGKLFYAIVSEKNAWDKQLKRISVLSNLFEKNLILGNYHSCVKYLCLLDCEIKLLLSQVDELAAKKQEYIVMGI